MRYSDFLYFGTGPFCRVQRKTPAYVCGLALDLFFGRNRTANAGRPTPLVPRNPADVAADLAAGGIAAHRQKATSLTMCLMQMAQLVEGLSEPGAVEMDERHTILRQAGLL